MYAPPPTAVPVVPARRGFTQGPLLAACLLGLILFLIAATIVLALIPIYLPTRDANLVGTTDPYSFRLTPDQPLGNDGTLSADATNSINSQIAAGLGFPSTAIQSSGNGVVSSGASGKRKRRGFNLIRYDRQAVNGQKVYLNGRFLRSVCGVCKITRSQISIFVTFVYGGVTRQINFVVEIFTQTISIPATLASTVSTTISSGFNGNNTANTGNSSSNGTTTGVNSTNSTNSSGSG